MAITQMELGWLQTGGQWDEHFDGNLFNGILISANREDIFSDPPNLSFSSKNHKDKEGDLNLLLSGPSLEKDKFRLPRPGEAVPMKLVGDPERGTARRVYEYIGKDSGLDFRLGLTVHEAMGTWSSEPHDFELEALKSFRPMQFWEQFAYITDPPNEWGIQTRRGFMADGSWLNDMTIIGDRFILDIPLGVHMVTAAPGVRLAYIWVYQAEDITKAEKF